MRLNRSILNFYRLPYEHNMKLVRVLQHKSEVITQIKDLLNELSSKFNCFWEEISRRVGVAASTLSKNANGKIKGGPQLLAALLLLKKLIEFERIEARKHQGGSGKILAIYESLDLLETSVDSYNDNNTHGKYVEVGLELDSVIEQLEVLFK